MSTDVSTNVINQTPVGCDKDFTIRLAVLSNKTGAERKKEVEKTLGRVIISAIKQKMAQNKEK